MKAAKERKMDRKRKHKALAVAKTERSRARRLANKAKRDEILAINPDAKIIVKNQKTYLGNVSRSSECYVENGKIEYVVKDPLAPTSIINRSISSNPLEIGYNPEEEKLLYDSIIDEDEVNVIEEIKAKNRSAIQRLTDKFKRK